MFYLSPEGDRYYLGRAFSYYALDDEGEFLREQLFDEDGEPTGERGEVLTFNYGAGSANVETFEKLGFTPVVYQQRPDDAYYTVSGPDETGAYNATPRDLDLLKLSKILEQKQTARSFLSPSDWYVIRYAELEVEVPAEWTAYRANVRGAADLRCEQIAAVTSVEELESLMKEPDKITVESDSDPSGYALLDNPDPHLEPWPEPIEEAVAVATSYELPYEAGQLGY